MAALRLARPTAALVPPPATEHRWLQGAFQDAFDAVQSGAQLADEEVQAAWKHPIVQISITVTEGPPAQVTTSKLAALQASLSGKKPAPGPNHNKTPESPLVGSGVKGRAAPPAPPPPPRALRSIKSLPAQPAQPQTPTPAPAAAGAVARQGGDTAAASVGPVSVQLRLEAQDTCEGEHSFAVRLSGFPGRGPAVLPPAGAAGLHRHGTPLRWNYKDTCRAATQSLP